jgi:hypothetical protein
VAAILLGVAVCPRDASIVVHSDSQAAIHQAAAQLSHTATAARRVRTPSTDSWSVLRHVLSSRGIKITRLVKVRGHSGIEGNKVADRRAKDAAAHPNAHAIRNEVVRRCDVPHQVALRGVPIRWDPRKVLRQLGQSAYAGAIVTAIEKAKWFPIDAHKDAEAAKYAAHVLEHRSPFSGTGKEARLPMPARNERLR